MGTLWQDMRSGFRLLTRNPGLALMAILALSVGISVCTALFGLVNWVLFRPSPFADPARVVHLQRYEYSTFTYPDYLALQGQITSLSGLAAAVVLTTTTALLFRSYLKYCSIDLGFQKKNVLVVDLQPERGDPDRQSAFYLGLASGIESLPGVTNVSLSLSAPFFFDRYSRTHQVSLPDHNGAGSGGRAAVTYNLVDHRYFQTLGVPLLRGRGFSEQDDRRASGAVIINETMAHRFWPDANPIGQFLQLDGTAEPLQVVGVVQDGKYYDIGRPSEPYMYIPLGQEWNRDLTLLIATEGDPRVLEEPVRRMIRRLDPALDVYPVTTLAECLRQYIESRKVVSSNLVGLLSLLGLIMAGTGLYGIIAFAVSRRTHELGIRMALGARQRDVVKMVIGQGLKVSLTGLGIGLVGSTISGWVLQALMFGVGPFDPVALAVSSLALLMTAVLALCIPAWRAARVDPMVALRYE